MLSVFTTMRRKQFFKTEVSILDLKKKKLKLLNEKSNIPGYKINIQKSTVFYILKTI